MHIRVKSRSRLLQFRSPPKSASFWAKFFIVICAALLVAQFLGPNFIRIDYNVYYADYLSWIQVSLYSRTKDSAIAPTKLLDTAPQLKIDTEQTAIARASVLTQPGAEANSTLCPLVPAKLVGPLAVSFTCKAIEELNKIYSGLSAGGHGRPATNCTSRHRVAIIVPFRDRLHQLECFLEHMHPILLRQDLDYAIYVVEQIPNQTFNRAKLMNIGAMEALKHYDWQCFIFHDVDLLPEDDRNLYTCPEQPRHMSVAVDKLRYRLLYHDLFGGVTALTVEQFKRLNGYSNDYWGWGGEDDDMSRRLRAVSYGISRNPAKIARYKMIKHSREKSNPTNKCRFNLLKRAGDRWKEDGLTSLNYSLLSARPEQLFTRFVADLLESETRGRVAKFGC